ASPPRATRHPRQPKAPSNTRGHHRHPPAAPATLYRRNDSALHLDEPPERRRRRERRPESELHKRRPRLRAGLWTERVAFLLAFTLAGINVLLARTFPRVVKVEQERDSGPRPRAMRRRGTFEQVLGPQQDPANASSPGRAPPWA